MRLEDGQFLVAFNAAICYLYLSLYLKALAGVCALDALWVGLLGVCFYDRSAMLFTLPNHALFLHSHVLMLQCICRAA